MPRDISGNRGVGHAMRNGSSGCHISDIDGLVVGKKLEACVGSVGADDTFT